MVELDPGRGCPAPGGDRVFLELIIYFLQLVDLVIGELQLLGYLRYIPEAESFSSSTRSVRLCLNHQNGRQGHAQNGKETEYLFHAFPPLI